MEALSYRPSGSKQEVKMIAEKIELGDLTMVNSSGNVHIADDTASEKVGGPALQTVDNSAGSAGGDTIEIDTGGALWWAQHQNAVPSTPGQVDLTGGGSGTLDTITADGDEILGGAVAFDSDLATTAANAIAQINASNGRFFAYLSGTAEINVVERIVTKESFTVVSTSTTITTSDQNASGGTVLGATDIGEDLYAVSGKVATLASGNVVIGTVERILDDNDEAFASTAGYGEVEITGSTGSISQISVGGTNLMSNTISYTTIAENTATLIAADINLTVNTHKYFAVASGAKVKIYQTTASLDEDVSAVVVTGALENTVLRNVRGGEVPRVLVDLKPYGSA